MLVTVEPLRQCTLVSAVTSRAMRADNAASRFAVLFRSIPTTRRRELSRHVPINVSVDILQTD